MFFPSFGTTYCKLYFSCLPLKLLKKRPQRRRHVGLSRLHCGSTQVQQFDVMRATTASCASSFSSSLCLLVDWKPSLKMRIASYCTEMCITLVLVKSVEAIWLCIIGYIFTNRAIIYRDTVYRHISYIPS